MNKHVSKPLVIIESPLAGDVEMHMSYARHCLRDSLSRGEAPIASHLLHTQVLSDEDPDERLLGLAAGHAWIRRADLMAVYDDYGVSAGMYEAMAIAAVSGIRIEFRHLIGRRRGDDHVGSAA